MRILFLSAIIIGISLCKNASQPPHRIVKPFILSIYDVIIDPGQISTINYDKESFDFLSISLEKQQPNGSWEQVAIADYDTFDSDDKYALDGCVPFQSLTKLTKVISTKININQDQSSARFTSAVYFSANQRFIMITSTFQVYYFSYSKLSNSTEDSQFNIALALNLKSILPANTEQWAYGFSMLNICYILTNSTGLFFPSTASSINDVQTLQNYWKRDQIFDVVVYKNTYVWVACGNDGLDLYKRQSGSSQLSLQETFTQLTLQTELQSYSIELVRVVTQGSKDLLLLMAKGEGILVFKITENVNISLTYLYLIPIETISSFDAVTYTLAVTLSSRAAQSGLELFFDSSNYYINYFENEEIQADQVILDPNSRAGLWVGEDFTRTFVRSVYKDNLQYRRSISQDFIDMQGEAKIILFQKDSQQYVFSLGLRKIEIFNLTSLDQQIICHSSNGGQKQDYRFELISFFCGNRIVQSSQETADFMFSACKVSGDLHFIVNDALIDSSNIGMYVGLSVGILIFVILSLVASACYLKRLKKQNVEYEKIKFDLGTKTQGTLGNLQMETQPQQVFEKQTKQELQFE